MKITSLPIFLTVITLVVVGIFFLNSSSRYFSPYEIVEIETIDKEKKSKIYKAAKEITSPDGFINTESQSITIGEFVGKKVVLIDFWTYSCINCQRTLPYLNKWYEKYKNEGLEIIGIHTPEFEFEKKYDNVKKATEKFGIKFPVVLDNDFSTWRAYQNNYWPRKYLIDIDGYIIYDHIGEGAYEETEQKIKAALSERAIILKVNN
jgi:thiol-disulfide isomerase/thioredoxin